MPGAASFLPARRPELVIRAFGERGQHVVKDPRNGSYYTLGEQESFLLTQLDGEHTAEAICRAFTERFGEPLPETDLDQFLTLARAKGFLQQNGHADAAGHALAPTFLFHTGSLCEDGNGDTTTPTYREEGLPTDRPSASPCQPITPLRRPRQSILYWRKNLFDPDRLFTWVAPRLWFLWTYTFLVLSCGAIVLAAVLIWANRQELVSAFAQAWRWETVVLAWLTLLVTIACHEFAHGLTCKHHGGEVHEVGFLLLYFMPCFFCNVSDAWLFKEKSKRLAVMVAGGYCDLCSWALAVFVWRLTLPDSLLNYLAWVVLSVLGARLFFNFNPLLKLDGYYMLSDLLEIPNLRRRAWQHVTSHLRWLLWGAPRPVAQPWGQFLLGFGVASWLFSLTFLVVMIVALGRFLDDRWGLVGLGGVFLLG